ncbi:ankyrin repeat domain-containing protein [Alloacidobacterium dinghuense]|uniref:Ankyrin repeat domain-containing protein n=1 Tax=Alloacidobacterium dinghuense TaxID=2763107 RepID=A0A7G8BI20_9BACT|nr:ankyrin repeat domain-containing protein [Alloacidobacterium dinghuense]QNI32190.1 ankyrin repeat domain-containing protein [Alloacidobacterium dinghuense]
MQKLALKMQPMQSYTRRMSQHFFDLIRQGKTTEIAEAVEVQPSVAKSRDAQGISALMLSIYTQQPVIRDYLLAHLKDLDIFEAAATGDCGRLQQLIKEDAMSARAVSSDGWTPLHLAAAFAGPEPVTLLLEHGAHVHQFSHNPMHNQPLHACIALNHSLDVVAVLLECGADINATQHGGYTPLLQAAAAGRKDLVRLLLEHGARVDCICDRGKSPADYARERGHTEVAEILAEYAAHPA